MSKAIRISIRRLLVFFCLCSTQGTTLAADPLMLRTANNHPQDYPTGVAIKYMGTLLEKWSDGKIAIKNAMRKQKP